MVLPETTDCDDDGAVCTADGRKLTGEIREVVPGPATALTAEFVDVPGEHDGSLFIFRVHFSEEFRIGWRTMRDRVLDVTNGRVHNARRHDNPHNESAGMQANAQWEIRVIPDSADSDVTVSLPATTDCSATGAVCTEDGQALSAGIEMTVPAAPTVPLTAEFVDAPGEHDGSLFIFRVHFSEEFRIGWRTMRDRVLDVTNGRVHNARRHDNPHNESAGMQANAQWEIRVIPDSEDSPTSPSRCRRRPTARRAGRCAPTTGACCRPGSR